MAILLNNESKVLVQGITGREGQFHTQQMVAYGTNIVGGVTPGKGGQEVEGAPVFNTVREAVDATGANVSVIYVPAFLSADAILEAANAGVGLVICITEGVPVRDMLQVVHYVREFTNTRLVGPNCPGVISPGKCKVGIMPGPIHKEGRIGLISRSGTLTYEVVNELTKSGLGQSTCIGIGGDPLIGSRFVDLLPLFEADEETDAVVLIGEIGGTDEEDGAEFFQHKMKKPVVSFIAGRSAPPGKRMGHAGAIVTGGKGSAADKVKTLTAAGIPVATFPSEIPGLLRTVGVS